MDRIPDELEEACRKGNHEAIELWFAKKGSPAARSAHGETLLHWACDSGNLAAVGAALRGGCYANADNWRGAAPLIYLATGGGPQARECGELLLKAGADPRTTSGFSGRTPAQTAMKRGDDLYYLLQGTEDSINSIRGMSRRFEFKYRMAKWYRDSAYYYAAPEQIRDQQFPLNYKVSPEVKAAYEKGGVVEAWGPCKKLDIAVVAALTAFNKAFADAALAEAFDAKGDQAFAERGDPVLCCVCDAKADGAAAKCDRCGLSFCSPACRRRGENIHIGLFHGK